MSDTTITVISILIFLLLLAAGSAWLFFFYIPKKTLSVAGELAETVRNTLGLTPQVTVNQKVIYQRTSEILELAMIEQEFDVEYETSHKRLGSEKRITMRGSYKAKIGFDLKKGFNIEVRRGGLFRPGEIRLQLPRAEILSVEPVDVQKYQTSGWLNWVTKKDIESASQVLRELALDKASKLHMLEDAEKRIENRLNEALLPRLVHYQLGHRVEFLETSSPENKSQAGMPFELAAGEHPVE